MIDNDNRIWNDWGNRWWPSTYLIDKNGYVRYRWDGELNWESARGELIMRKKIVELLAEPSPKQTRAGTSTTEKSTDWIPSNADK